MRAVRLSLVAKTAIWATIAFAMAILVSFFASIKYSEHKSFQMAHSYSKQAATTVQDSFEGIDLATIARQRDTAAYAQMREHLRDICCNFGLNYLYIYVIDEDRQERRYLTAVAYDDDVDESVKELGPNTVITTPPISEHETAALRGYSVTDPYTMDNNHGKMYSWFFPYRDAQGTIKYVIGCDYDLKEVSDNITGSSIVLATIMGVQIALVIGLMLFKLRRQILKPLNEITLHISSFVDPSNTHDYVNQVEPLAFTSGDEIQQIADAFDTMSANLTEHVQRIQQLRDERVAASIELDVAQRIQDGLVPEEKQLTGTNYEGFAYARSARRVGGDFYDIFELGDGRVATVMGDVSGKGVSAALFMAMARTIIHETLCHNTVPAAALTEANKSICEQNPMLLFVTVFACILDPRTGELVYANAGHTHPVLFGNSCTFLQPGPGTALGLFEDAEVDSGSLTLEPGEGILLYTDGVTEATNGDKQLFGEERLLTAVRNARGAEETIVRAREAVADFVASAEQFDDLTLLALMRVPSSESVLELKPVRDSFDVIRKRLHNELGDGEEFKKVLLAVDEAFANIVNYAQATRLTFAYGWKGDTFELTLGDNGIPFDPLETPRTQKDFEDLEFGGMGIGLILSVTDDAHYERKDGQNLLTLCFVKRG